MKIKTILGRPFKGGTFDTSLTAITILAGKNAKHKSARLEAAQLALSGYLPGDVSRVGDIYSRFASNGMAQVGVVMDNDWSIVRRYIQNKKGSATCEVEVNGFDKDFTTPAILFDQTEFLSLSNTERNKYLFKVLPAPSLDKIGPPAIIANLKNWKHEELHTEEHEKTIIELCSFVQSDFNNAKLKEVSIQEWLSTLVETVKLKSNAAKASVKQFKQTILGMAEMKPIDEVALNIAEAAKKKAQSEWDAAKITVTTLESELKTLRGQYEEKLTLSKKAVDVTAAQKELDELIASEHAPIGFRPTIHKEQGVYEKASKDLTVVVRQANAAWNELKRIDQEIKDTEEATTCSKCRQSIVEIMKSVLKTLKKQKVEAEKEREKTKLAESSYISDVLNPAATALEQANQKIVDFDAIATKNTTRLNRISTLRLQISETSSANEALKILPELKQNGIAKSLLCEEAVKTRDYLKLQFDTTEQTHKQAIADAASSRAQQEAAKRVDIAQALAETTTALSDYLIELLKLCVEESVKPLVVSVRQMLDGLLPAPICFQEGELCMIQDNGYISWKSCSDSQQMLLCCALRLALAATSEYKIAVIGRFESVDEEMRPLFVKRMLELVEKGIIHQCIFVQVTGKYDVKIREYSDITDEEFSVVECK